MLRIDGTEYRVGYEPGESTTGTFGGNSNWRGPIWFPVNFLLIESLQKFHYYYGDELTVEFPTGSGQPMTPVASCSRAFAPIDAYFSALEGRQRALCTAAARRFSPIHTGAI